VKFLGKFLLACLLLPFVVLFFIILWPIVIVAELIEPDRRFPKAPTRT